MHQIIDNDIPDRAGPWKVENLFFHDMPDIAHTIRYRDPIEAIRSLWGDPSLSSILVYRPQKIFKTASKKERIYTELWTGKWWNAVQVCIPYSSHFHCLNQCIEQSS